MKNCWNKFKTLPAPVVVAGGGEKNDVFGSAESTAGFNGLEM